MNWSVTFLSSTFFKHSSFNGCRSELISPEEKAKRKLQLQKIINSEKKRTMKKKVKVANDMNKIFHSTKGPSTVTYITKKMSPVKIPNPYKDDGINKLEGKGFLRPTHRWKLCSDIRARVAVPEEEMSEISVNDPNYFSITQGRPIKEKFFKKDYIEKVKKITQNKVIKGFIKDEIKSKEERDKFKLYIMQKQNQELENISKSLSEFILEEQKNCENLEEELKEVTEIKNDKEAKLEVEKQEMKNVKKKFFDLSEQMEKIKKCRNFIMEIAPEEWKKNYEEIKIQRKDSVKEIANKLHEIFKTYKACCDDEDLEMETMIQNFLKEFSDSGPPKLPFDEPNQIFKIFREMELKCIRALNHNMNIEESVDRAKGIYENSKMYLENQKSALHEILSGLQKNIMEEKKRIEEREALISDLRNVPLKDLIASDEVLTEQALIKNMYFEMIERPKKNLSTLEMVHEIGDAYYDLKKRLRKFSPEDIETLEKGARKKLEVRMLEAKKAEERKKQVENMLKSLERSREKAFVKKGRPISFITPPLRRKVVKEKEIKKEIKTIRCVEDDIKSKFPLVWHFNHPNPGPYKPPQSPVQEDYEAQYPDLTLDEPQLEDDIFSTPEGN